MLMEGLHPPVGVLPKGAKGSGLDVVLGDVRFGQLRNMGTTEGPMLLVITFAAHLACNIPTEDAPSTRPDPRDHRPRKVEQQCYLLLAWERAAGEQPTCRAEIVAGRVKLPGRTDPFLKYGVPSDIHELLEVFWGPVSKAKDLPSMCADVLRAVHAPT